MKRLQKQHGDVRLRLQQQWTSTTSSAWKLEVTHGVFGPSQRSAMRSSQRVPGSERPAVRLKPDTASRSLQQLLEGALRWRRPPPRAMPAERAMCASRSAAFGRAETA